ncbi:hypothetical protein M885DRAFT_626067, partial [Pelagophyceae sp. CCMP2097]
GRSGRLRQAGPQCVRRPKQLLEAQRRPATARVVDRRQTGGTAREDGRREDDGRGAAVVEAPPQGPPHQPVHRRAARPATTQEGQSGEHRPRRLRAAAGAIAARRSKLRTEHARARCSQHAASGPSRTRRHRRGWTWSPARRGGAQENVY